MSKLTGCSLCKTLIGSLCLLATATAVCLDSKMGIVQRRLDEVLFESAAPETLEEIFGVAEIRAGDTFVEGYRDGALEALCTSARLAGFPQDRTLTLGKTRHERFYSYPDLGIVFRFLDNPTTLFEIQLSNRELSLNGVRPGDTISQARESFQGLPTLGRAADFGCSWRWGETTLYASCPAAGEEKEVKLVVVQNPDLPHGCELSFRGMYE